MPQSVSSWTNIDYINTGNALDARYWNKLVAPRNNLDYIGNFRNQSTAVLALDLTSQSIPNNVATNINWTSSVYQSFANMWDISIPNEINLFNTLSEDDSVGIWVVSIFTQWSVAGAFSAKSIQSDSTLTFIDYYGESSAGINSIHQHSFVKMTQTSSVQTINFTCVQVTGGVNNLTASLYLQRIPSAASLFYPL